MVILHLFCIIVHPFSPYKQGGDLRWQIGGDFNSQSGERKELPQPIRREEEIKKRDFKNIKVILLSELIDLAGGTGRL